MAKLIEIINGRSIVTGTVKVINNRRVTIPCKPYDNETKKYVNLA